MVDTVREGGCLCGAVHYKAVGELLWVAHCHCCSCRKARGAPMQTWIGLRRDEFAYTQGAPVVCEFSPGVRRAFCAACGTPLTYEACASPTRSTSPPAPWTIPQARRRRCTFGGRGGCCGCTPTTVCPNPPSRHAAPIRWREAGFIRRPLIRRRLPRSAPLPRRWFARPRKARKRSPMPRCGYRR